MLIVGPNSTKLNNLPPYTQTAKYSSFSQTRMIAIFVAKKSQ